MSFANDLFTDANDTLLSSHTSSSGASWTFNAAHGTSKISSNTVVASTAGSNSLAYVGVTPSSADYDVSCDVVLGDVSATNETRAGPAGRISTSADTCYFCRWYKSTGTVQLYKTVNGTSTLLGSYTVSFSSGNTYNLLLQMRGTAIKVLLDGVERISVNDSAISDANRAGIRTSASLAAIDNFVASYPAGDTASSLLLRRRKQMIGAI